MAAKWIGGLLVILACGGCGLMMAANDRVQERQLQQIKRVLEWIGCELSSRMWPIPVLFRQVAQMTGGTLSRILTDFAEELDRNAAPDAYSCMETVLDRYPGLHESGRQLLSELGRSLGRFDLEAQLREVVHLQQQAEQMLQEHGAGRDERRRCYQTLGLCVGAGLVIVLL